MNLSLYENASALRGLEQYQNVSANNIAASHVAGFKKVAVCFEAVEGGEIARSTHDRLRNEMPGSFPVMKNQVDYNEGEMKETSKELDWGLRSIGKPCYECVRSIDHNAMRAITLMLAP